MRFSQITAWGWFWTSFFGVGLAVEVYWLIVNSANTLSRQIWGVEQLDLAHPLNFGEWTPFHWILSLLLWGGFAWLSVHFPFGYIR